MDSPGGSELFEDTSGAVAGSHTGYPCSDLMFFCFFLTKDTNRYAVQFTCLFFKFVNGHVSPQQQKSGRPRSVRISRSIHPVRPHVQLGRGVWQLAGNARKGDGGQKRKADPAGSPRVN